MAFSWQCPYCGHHATIGDANARSGTGSFDEGTKYGRRHMTWSSITCPNKDCGEFTLRVWLRDAVSVGGAHYSSGKKTQYFWQLVPPAEMKILPDYVPPAIVADYKEACLIAELSPKASATLSRRCLQGMIRDFWGVSKSRLVDEIAAIEGKVDELAWNAIDGVRRMGNIGAHMEKDINVIVDVDPNEARAMIDLIETLIDDWYVTRHQRTTRMQKMVDAVKEKFAPKAEATE